MRATMMLLLGAAALAGCQPNRAQPEPVASQPVYCYKTLGDAVCYAQPRNGEYFRLLGYEGPAPQTFGYAGTGKY